MKVIEIEMNKERGVKLTGYLQEVGGEFEGIHKRPAVIVLPGGGYGICSDREADPVALEFARVGYQAYILRYTVRAEQKELIWPHPINDYDEAFDLIKEHADEWFVDTDRIAVCGFSAGGHLAACTATIAKNRPKAAILVYPAINDDMCDFCAPGLPRPAQEVDDLTPPCFISAARDDLLVSVSNAMNFASALTENGINFELHIHSYGNHGYSNGARWVNQNSISRGAQGWMNEATRFLEEVWGIFTSNGFTKPEIKRCVSGDMEKYLSVDCTVLYLEQQGERISHIIGEQLKTIDTIIKAKGYDGAAASYVKTLYTLRGMLEVAGLPKEYIDSLDNELNTIEAIRG
ncbi:TPA: alpha/beta hydrolase [Streptococcus suis]|nr:alpha/beta hydrolase [Streptococcus suis]